MSKNFPDSSQSLQVTSPITVLKMVGVLFVLGFLLLVGLFIKNSLSFLPSIVRNTPFLPEFEQKVSMKKFTSAEEFRAYLQDQQANQQNMNGAAFASDMAVSTRETTGMMAPQAMMKNSESAPAGEVAQRVSETNVQVKGIDEPDIVKTDGKSIFFSSQGSPMYTTMPGRPALMTEKRLDPGFTSSFAPEIYPPIQQPVTTTKVIQALPISALREQGKIEKTGELLLANNTLLVLAQDGVYAYDVKDQTRPTETWKLRFDEQTQLQTARLKGDQLYLITRNSMNQSVPCPIMPLTLNDQKLTVACTDISYPEGQYQTDSIFSVFSMRVSDGKLNQTNAFVGSSGNSTIYMSPDALYITYQNQGDLLGLMTKFLQNEAKDLFPTATVERLQRLHTYDLSYQTKMMEMQTILEQHQRTLSADDRLKLENELRNRSQAYLKAHARELETTTIVKSDLESLQVRATGQVPGRLLNQFSLDEFDGNLRVATTFGGSWTQLGQAESASDVYVLGAQLQHKGAVKDLGVTERIYAVRFLGNRGYLVTFRQTDPFYVLDLSDAANPRKAGELKIPGFSSYLHPLQDGLVLGVGSENNQVKLSLFDVKDPTNPTEVAKYLLDESWTEVSNTHHAFLQDEKHQVFFMPGSKGGYVFSYRGGQLQLTKAVSNTQVKRALYINNYLYIVGEKQLTVLDENTWQQAAELQF